MTDKKGIERMTGMEVAVIGMSGRFPGARDIAEFWENLKNGVESISFFSPEELEKTGVEPGIYNDPHYVDANGVLEAAEYFDSSFFGYTPKEAEMMNPQMRLFHEGVWHALEDAGYDPYSYNGSIGLYAGAGSSFDWEALALLSGTTFIFGQFQTGNLTDRDFLCTRVSYKLNLKGPAFIVQTACSTSLVAVHLACRALLTGECKIALAGGISLSTTQKRGYTYQEGMVMSPDGHCRAFDASAGGIIGGNGLGVVALKSFKEAVADRDYIYAVVKGSAINNDGVRKVGYTAPSVEGQREVIRMAQRISRVNPHSIGYIETHGTGTTLGDPVEVEALTLAFASDKKGFCALGSVKTNVGHLNSAAGVTGFIKAVLSLQHKQIPPSLNYQTPNPKIDFENSPFYVNNKLMEWKNETHPRRAGVSAFGIGGTNAHVILEEAPVVQNTGLQSSSLSKGTLSQERAGVSPLEKSRDYQLILLSANTQTALDKMTGNLAGFLKNNPGINLADAVYTLQVGRTPLKFRRRLVCADAAEAIETLSLPTSEKMMQNTVSVKKENPPLVFMFSGQGSQYVNMGLDLYRNEPLFRQEIDRCAGILEEKMGCNITDILYPGENTANALEESEAKERMDYVTHSGPIKFTFEYALAKLIMNWGIKPAAMIGHSFGEYVVAHLAGVFCLEDALELVVLRGKLMEKMPPGAMMSVPLSEDELKPLLNDEISLAAVNTPKLCIISGPTDAVEGLERELSQKGYECLRINFPRASHSKMMKPILNQFKEKLGKIKLSKPEIPYISGLTGNWITVSEAADPGYWARHLVETVRFYDGLGKLLDQMNPILVQVGSDRGLPLFVSQHPDIKTENVTINLLRHPREKVSDVYYILDQLGLLWSQRIKIDWSGFYEKESRYRIPLPKYPFEGQAYPAEGDPLKVGAEMMAGNSRFRGKNSFQDWFYVPSWIRNRPLPGKIRKEEKQSQWLIFSDHRGIASLLHKRLEENDHNVITVKAGPEFIKESSNTYTINPAQVNDYDSLLHEVTKNKNPISTIVHMWGVTGDGDIQSLIKRFDNAQETGFYSLVYLARALGNQGITNPLRINVITDNMQEVIGDDLLYPEKATTIGAVKTIPLEYTNIDCQSIDIILPPEGSYQEENLIRQLLTELTNPTTDPVLAYRGNHRWVQTVQPVLIAEEEPGDKSVQIKKGGVYLVIGGLGGVGFQLAEDLAKTAQARLILTGRSPLPGREEWEEWLSTHDEADPTSVKIRNLHKLEEWGAEVITFSADVSSPEKMQEVIDQAGKRFGPIHGVLHCAGVPAAGAIQRKTREMMEDALSAKVKGTLVLDHLFKDESLDFLVLCSSLNSVLPGFGHVDYCAANAFLDAFANCKRSGKNRMTISINWDRWKNIGMSVSIEARHKEMTGEELPGMTGSEGAAAFKRILGDPLPQVFVSIENLADKLEQLNRYGNELTRPPEVLEEDSTAEIRYNRPQLSTIYAAPGNTTEQKLADIWGKFFGYKQVGVDDDFFQLGGDSLKATILISQMHRELHVKIPLSQIFKTPSIRELAEYLQGQGTAGEKFTSIEAVEEKEYYALSSAQKRMYILQQMEPESTAYNVLQIITLKEEPAREQLEQTIGKLIKRHENLRTFFEMQAGKPVQVIEKEIGIKIQYHEGHKTGKRDVERIMGNFIRPFDLKTPPLIRVGLLTLAPTGCMLAIDMHHIIADAFSINLLMEEFASLYRGEQLPPLRLQYKDYAEWNSKLMRSEKIKRQENYWLEQFAGEVPVLAIPTDYERPKVQNFEGVTINFNIGNEQTQKLKELALEEGVTMFMMTLAIFYILLYKITGQEDIVVGTPGEGRQHPDLRKIIGMFINTLPLRNRPTEGKNFKEFLGEIKNETLSAFENQDYQFEELVEQLAVKRAPDRNPLFDVLFGYRIIENELASSPGGHHGDMNHEPNGVENRISKYDLILNIENADNILLGILRYKTRLFKQETIERFICYYKNIIAEVIENPGKKLGQFEMISEGEKRELLQQEKKKYFNKEREIDHERNEQMDVSFNF